jgi:hypothetical protein
MQAETERLFTLITEQWQLGIKQRPYIDLQNKDTKFANTLVHQYYICDVTMSYETQKVSV